MKIVKIFRILFKLLIIGSMGEAGACGNVVAITRIRAKKSTPPLPAPAPAELPVISETEREQVQELPLPLADQFSLDALVRAIEQPINFKDDFPTLLISYKAQEKGAQVKIEDYFSGDILWGAPLSENPFFHKRIYVKDSQGASYFDFVVNEVGVTLSGEGRLNVVLHTDAPLYFDNFSTKGSIDVRHAPQVHNKGLLEAEESLRIQARAIYNNYLRDSQLMELPLRYAAGLKRSIMTSRNGIFLKSFFLNNDQGKISSSFVYGYVPSLWEGISNKRGSIKGTAHLHLYTQALDQPPRNGIFLSSQGTIAFCMDYCRFSESNRIRAENFFFNGRHLDFDGVSKIKGSFIAKVAENFIYKTESFKAHEKSILALNEGMDFQVPIDHPGSLEIWLHPKASKPLKFFSDVQVGGDLTLRVPFQTIDFVDPKMNIHVKGGFGIWQDGIQDLETPEARPAIPLLPHRTIDMRGKIKAEKGLNVYAPRATLRIGNTSSEAEILLEDACLRTYVHSFDLEGGLLAAQKAFIEASSIRVGRLLKDPERNSLSTFYRHAQRSDSHNLGCDIGNVRYNFLGQVLTNVYSQGHLLTLPLAISNQASLLVKETADLKGSLLNQGVIETQHMLLNSPKESLCEAGSLTVKGDCFLKGAGLRSKRHVGTLNFDYYMHNYGYRFPSPSTSTFVSSDPAKMIVQGRLFSESPLINEGSIIYFYEKSPETSIHSQDINSSLYQKFMTVQEQQKMEKLSLPSGSQCWFIHQCADFVVSVPGDTPLPSNSIASNGCLRAASIFYHRSKGLSGAQNSFKANTSSSQGMFLPSSVTMVQGHITTPAILATVGEKGLSLGSGSTVPVQNKTTTHNLVPQKIDLRTIETEGQTPSKKQKDSIFRFHERFWFDGQYARDFYKDLQDQIVIYTPQGLQKLEKDMIFSLSPGLLVKTLREICQEVLKRGYLYPYRLIDESLIKELHINAAQYILKNHSQSFNKDFAAALLEQEQKNPLKIPPMLYYVAVKNQDGFIELNPVIYFPPAVIKEAVGQGEGRIKTSFLGVMPEGFTTQEIAAYLQDNYPALHKEVEGAFKAHFGNIVETPFLKNNSLGGADQDSHQKTELKDRSVPVSGSSSLKLRGEMETGTTAIITKGDILTTAHMKTKDALLSSLCGNVVLKSQVEHKDEGTGNRHSKILSQACIEATGEINIQAGKNIAFIGAKTVSSGGTDIKARNIYDFSIPLENSSAHKTGNTFSSSTMISHHPSEHRSKEVISFKAGDTITLQAPKVEAPQAYLSAQWSVSIEDVPIVQTHSLALTEKESGIQKFCTMKTSQGANFGNTELFVESARGNINCTNLEGKGQTILKANDGSVGLNLGETMYEFACIQDKNNKILHTHKERKERNLTYVPLALTGSIDIQAKQAYVQVKEGKRVTEGDTTSYVSQRDAQALGNIKSNVPLKLTPVEDTEKIYGETKKRLTPGFKTVLGLAAGTLVGPVAGTLLGSVTSALGIEGTLAAAAGKAALTGGLTGVAFQVAEGLIVNDVKLDPASLGRSVAVAGLTAGICEHLGFHGPSSDQIRDMKTMGIASSHLSKEGVKAGVSAAFDLMQGKQDVMGALKEAVTGTIVNSAAATGANHLSIMRGNAINSLDKGGLGNQALEAGQEEPTLSLNFVEHKLGHGILGGLSALLKGGLSSSPDLLKGAVTGATSAVLAESLVEVLSSTSEEVAQEIRRESGDSLTKEEFRKIYLDKSRKGEIVGKMAPALMAFVTDQDVDVAVSSADNAVNNNYLQFILAGLNLAWNAYDIHEAYQKKGMTGAIVAAGEAAITGAIGGVALKGASVAVKKTTKFIATKVGPKTAIKRTPQPGRQKMMEIGLLKQRRALEREGKDPFQPIALPQHTPFFAKRCNPVPWSRRGSGRQFKTSECSTHVDIKDRGPVGVTYPPPIDYSSVDITPTRPVGYNSRPAKVRKLPNEQIKETK